METQVRSLCSTSNQASHPNHWPLYAVAIDSIAEIGKQNQLFSRESKETRRYLRAGHVW